MLPDVVHDSVTDVAQRKSYQFVERVFYEAARSARLPNANDVALALYRVWIRDGYEALPGFVKEFCLNVLNGEALDCTLSAL